MTRQEFGKGMAMLSAAIDKPITTQTLEAWFEILNDLPADAYLAAIKMTIAENEYPTLPAVGLIRRKAVELMNGERPTAADAWGQVSRALHLHGSYNQEAALKSMDPAAAEIVKWMGWRDICQTENISVTRGQFIKLYDSQETRRKQQQLMPPDVRRFLNSAVKSLPGGGTQ